MYEATDAAMKIESIGDPLGRSYLPEAVRLYNKVTYFVKITVRYLCS